MGYLRSASKHSNSSALTGLGVRLPSSALSGAGRAFLRSGPAAAILLWCATLASLPSGSRAATFAVDSTFDEVDVLAGDSLCATERGRCTLRAAIQESNALAGADRIVLPAGTYVLMPPGVDDDPGLDVTDGLELDGEDVATTIVQGSSPMGAILRVDTSAGGVTVRDLTLQDGAGGIVQEGCCALLTLARVRVTRMDVGIFAESSLSATDLVVEHTGDGIVGAAPQLGTTVVRGCARTGVTNLHGPMSLTDSVVADCLGTGVDDLGSGSSIVRSTITRNRGGGVRNSAFGLVTLRDTTVSGNVAARGGGIMVGSLDAGAVLINCTVSGNRADEGGGVWAGGSCVAFSIVNGTISGNLATGHGGGIYDGHSGCGRSTLDNVTVAGNVADADGDGTGDGGGLAALGEPVVVAHTILADNADRGAEAPDCIGSLDAARYSLIEVAGACQVRGDASGLLVGVDAALDPLADNGGHTPTHGLRAASPAIDAGDPAGCRDVAGDPITTDQRGVSRPQGPACDMGAVEVVCDAALPDLDRDGIGDVCDPEDAALRVSAVRLRPDGRSVRQSGTVEVAGVFSTAPPADVVGDAGLTLLVRDGSRLVQRHVWEGAQCQRSPRGRTICRSADGLSTCMLRPVRAEPAQYRFRARLRRLSLAGPFRSPVSVVLTHPSGIDRVGTAASCEVAPAGALTCGGGPREGRARRRPPT